MRLRHLSSIWNRENKLAFDLINKCIAKPHEPSHIEGEKKSKSHIVFWRVDKVDVSSIVSALANELIARGDKVVYTTVNTIKEYDFRELIATHILFFNGFERGIPKDRKLLDILDNFLRIRMFQDKLTVMVSYIDSSKLRSVLGNAVLVPMEENAHWVPVENKIQYTD